MTMHSFLTHDRFLLGTFSSNCSGGMTVSKLPERWVANWQNNLKLGQMLDDAGIDFMLPIGRWKGYGGDTGYQEARDYMRMLMPGAERNVKQWREPQALFWGRGQPRRGHANLGESAPPRQSASGNGNA